MIGLGVIILALAIFFIAGGNGAAKSTGNVVTEVLDPIDEGDVVKIPLSQVSTSAQWHDYNSQGTDIEYFIVKDKNGNVKTAFNACDVCYRSKKGYSQSGGDMVCNNCGNHYAIAGLGTKNLAGGGCWPGYLPSTIEGDYVVIKKSDLEAGKYRF